MKTKLIAVVALAAIMSVAVIVASVEQPTMAINQNHNGASHNSAHGTNANGASGGANGGVGGDAAKAGTGENGGTNTMGSGCGSTC